MTKVGSLVVLINFIIVVVVLPHLLIADNYSKVFISYITIIVLCSYILYRNWTLAIKSINSSNLLKSINIFLVYLSIHYLVAILRGIPHITFVYLVQIGWVFCANAFYVYGLSKKVDFTSFEKRMAAIGLCLVLYLFFKQLSFSFDMVSVVTDSSVAAEFININPYILASLTGILFLFKRHKVIIPLAVLIILVGILITGKRGPLVSIMGAVLVITILHNGFFAKIKIFALLTVMCFIIYVIVIAYYPTTIDYLVNRMIEDDTESLGSGRVGAWIKGYEIWSDMGIFVVLFGMGTGTVNMLMYKAWGLAVGAHSDFFDVLFQYGYVGLFFQLIYCLKIVVIILRAKNKPYSNSFKYIAAFILISMVYTMSYSSPSMIISSTLLFYYLGRMKFLLQEKQNRIVNKNKIL